MYYVGKPKYHVENPQYEPADTMCLAGLRNFGFRADTTDIGGLLSDKGVQNDGQISSCGFIFVTLWHAGNRSRPYERRDEV